MNQGGGLACCAVCNNQTYRRCSRCLNIYYCNTEHQRQDWKRHKSECAPKIPKQGSKKNITYQSSSSKSDNQEEKKARNVEESESRHVKESDSETRHLKSSKKSVKIEGSSIGTKQNSVRQNEQVQSGSEKNKNDSSITSSVVYTNKDLTKQSAITYEGSSEQEILSESAQQISAVEYPTSSTNVLHSVNRTESEMLFALPNYQPEHTQKDYPEVSLKSGVTYNTMPNNCYTDPTDPWYATCQRLIRDMNKYGVCVLDNFLGKDRGSMVRNEVMQMYQSGMFEAGRLVSSPARTETRTVRSDRTMWIDGEEPQCFYIKQLISQVDNIVLRANKMPNNGKMGDYIINERTKAMVACYPGSGSHYVKHVDNPNKDGRCITAIYYLNLDWDVTRCGGLLRVFPEGINQVADISPIFDRMLFFWSDRRNPHEVQPAYDTRYAITLWYFDAQERKEARRHFQERGQPSTSN